MSGVEDRLNLVIRLEVFARHGDGRLRARDVETHGPRNRALLEIHSPGTEIIIGPSETAIAIDDHSVAGQQLWPELCGNGPKIDFRVSSSVEYAEHDQ